MSDPRFVLDLDSDDYRDRVYGCWQGKNAGGTLGAPLEEVWGTAEPFDVWWYPQLQEGGLPNDDLEMQLIWLKALEEVGPRLTARDLSRYWLDHIGYNWDEYGLSKLNLRWGLEPPLSGYHNNWFADCMGAPIRSEIWACVAPGQPRIAARYAYLDASCDHAGGEGIYGELFNAALESAAFVLQDPAELIDIALSYIPSETKVAAAVQAAVAAYAEGLDWQMARRRVLDAAWHYNAQYAPVNTGFQVIGLLYGTDFGHAMCLTVNCGYDTDSSGAAIGSYLGILHGSRQLPQRWVEPLGTTIATNESWGGVRHLGGANPIPATLDELLVRIRAAARRVLAEHGVDARFEVSLSELYADDTIASLLAQSPTTVPFPGADITSEVAYGTGPVVVPGQPRTVTTWHRNNRLVPTQAKLQLSVPEGWSTTPESAQLRLAPGEKAAVRWQISAPEEPATSTTLQLAIEVTGRPAGQSVPIVLLGAYAVDTSQVLPGTLASLSTTAPAAAQLHWTRRWASGYAQPLAEAFNDQSGVVYLRTWVHSPTQREAWVIFDPSTPVRYWVNGQLAGGCDDFRRIRPHQSAAEQIGGPVVLQAGRNEIFIQAYHDGRHPPAELHLGFTSNDELHTHLWDLRRTGPGQHIRS